MFFQWTLNEYVDPTSNKERWKTHIEIEMGFDVCQYFNEISSNQFNVEILSHPL